MEIPEKAKEILKHEGVVALATQGKDGPYLINTWHSYIQLTAAGNLVIPAGGMKRTEENVLKDNRIVATIGSREVTGMRGPGAGFVINGTAKFLTSGNQYDMVKKKFPWARAALEIVIDSAEQTI